MTIFVENMQSDPGRVEVVWMAGVVARHVPGHCWHAEGGAGGGLGVLDLDDTGPRHQLPIVLPDHEPGTDNGGGDDTLQLQTRVLPHIDVRPTEYPHLLHSMVASTDRRETFC